MRKVCIGLIVLVALWGTAYSILSCVPCYPVSAVWDFGIEAKCWGYNSPSVQVFVATWESHMTLTMVLDIIVFSVPIPLYFKKDTDGRTRLGLISLLFGASM
jgi:hypothetical protein